MFLYKTIVGDSPRVPDSPSGASAGMSWGLKTRQRLMGEFMGQGSKGRSGGGKTCTIPECCHPIDYSLTNDNWHDNHKCDLKNHLNENQSL